MSLVLYNTVYTAQEYVVPDWGSCTDAELAIALEKHYAGEINLHDHWNIGDERTVELTTGETIQMILMHKGQYPIVGEKIDTPEDDLPVGTVIQLNENGSPVDYIVVHQGNPGPNMYDASCDGMWVLRKDILEERAWDSDDNDYKNSDIHSYLNGTFLNLFDNDTKNAIKQVKIPYYNDIGAEGSVASGPNSLSCKIFLLSGYEVGFSVSDNLPLPRDGAKLSYFNSGADSAANNKRIANYNGSASDWWLRSSDTSSPYYVGNVSSSGSLDVWDSFDDYGVRPAFILDTAKTNPMDLTCAFVVGMKDCLNETYVMNDSNSNASGWEACDMRTYLNSTVYAYLPDSFKQLLKQVNVWTADGGIPSGTMGVYSQDYLALPAEKEIYGNNHYADRLIELGLFQFDWYKTASNRIKLWKGEATEWWGRSPVSSITSWNTFCAVDNSGGATNTASIAHSGVSFFCAI